MFFWQNRQARQALHILDLVLVTCAFLAAYEVRRNHFAPYLSGLSSAPNYYLLLIFYLFFTNFFLNHFSFAEPVIISGRRFRELVKTTAIPVAASCCLIFVLYLLHEEPVSRLFLLLLNCFTILLLSARRYAVSFSLQRSGAAEKQTVNILVIGSKDRAKETIRTIKTAPEHIYKVIGCLDLEEKEVGRQVCCGVRVMGTMERFRPILLEKVVDEIIFALPLQQIPDVNEQISFAEKLGVRVLDEKGLLQLLAEYE